MNIVTLSILLLLLCTSVTAAPKKVVFCTDIGSDIDDAWALAFALKCPEIEIDSVLVSHGPTPLRAKVAGKLLSIAGRDDIPVLVGKSRRLTMNGQRSWAKDFVPKKPFVADGARALARRLMKSQEKMTLIPVGALTDVALMLKFEPKVKEKIEEIVMMGGSIYRGHGGSEPCAEFNILSDVHAAQVVFESGVPIIMLPLDVTTKMQPGPENMKLIAQSDKPLVKAMQELFMAWGHPTPTLFDVVAVAMTFKRDLLPMEHKCIKVTDDGFTRIIEDGKPNVYVCTSGDQRRIMDLFMERILK